MLFHRFSAPSRPEAERLKAEVGEQLLAAMISRNLTHRLTRQQVCDRLGLSRSRLDGPLAGSADLTLSHLAAIAHSLGAELKVEIRVPGEG